VIAFAVVRPVHLIQEEILSLLLPSDSPPAQFRDCPAWWIGQPGITVILKAGPWNIVSAPTIFTGHKSIEIRERTK